jgi:protein-tyrosine phosphatase
MDQRNIVNMSRIVGSDTKKKISRLLEFAGVARDIADPWYTGDFDQTYDDVYKGCTALLEHILSKGEVNG